MKKFYILTSVILFAFQTNAQWEWVNINFDDSSYLNYIFIDTANYPDNIWQVGSPDKTVFNEAYSLPNAIVTDTVQTYPANNTSVFYIRYITPETIPGWWIYSGLHFFYKVDTDEDSDYGKIEFSPDNGELWIDYLNDTIYNNCYFSNNPPYFTGSSDDWEYFEIYNDPWCFGINEGDTVWYRFTFFSDENQTGKDGFIIDDISLWDMTETIGEFKNNNQTLIATPNPVYNESVTFSLSSAIQFDNLELKCFDIYGTEVSSKKINKSRTESNIDVSNWPAGIYLAVVYTGDIVSGQCKFIIK